MLSDARAPAPSATLRVTLGTIRIREVAVSYQFELPRVPRAEVVDALRDRAEGWMARTTMVDGERQAVADHVEGAVRATEIMLSRMGGLYDGPDIRVVVTGHANPGHKPREGYSDEHITISIGVLPAEDDWPAVPAEPEAVVLKPDEQMMDPLVAGS